MRARPILCLLIAVLALSGCVPETVTQTPTPTASATDTPIFASEDEALAAAEAAYAEYVRVATEIGTDGGSKPERIEEVATPEMALREVEAFERFESTGRKTQGAPTVLNFELQSYAPDASVVAYICSDISRVRVLEANGTEVDSQSRTALTALQVTFKWNAHAGRLLVDSRESWPGEGVC